MKKSENVLKNLAKKIAVEKLGLKSVVKILVLKNSPSEEKLQPQQKKRDHKIVPQNM